MVYLGKSTFDKTHYGENRQKIPIIVIHVTIIIEIVIDKFGSNQDFKNYRQK